MGFYQSKPVVEISSEFWELEQESAVQIVLSL